MSTGAAEETGPADRAAGCAVFGLLLVLIRSLASVFRLAVGWHPGAFLAAGSPGAASPLAADPPGLYGCLTVGLAALLGLEVFIINRGRSDMTPLPADGSSSWGGVALSCPWSLRTRLRRPWTIWSGGRTSAVHRGTGYEIVRPRCMYDYLGYGRCGRQTALILEDPHLNTAEDRLSCELLTEAGWTRLEDGWLLSVATFIAQAG